MAANCLRSLLLHAGSKKTVADLTITRFLFPRLIAFVTDTNREDLENARMLVAQALCQYVGTLSKDHSPIAMALVIPMLLSRAASEDDVQDGGVIAKETSARLLELASADQSAFRAVVGGMGEEQRGFMEGVIRSGRALGQGRDKGGQGEEEERPTIALKMNFGG